PDVEIVGSCADGRSAVAAIQRHSPDLVFLDVQMPGLDGFGVLTQLPSDRLPLVIFVTAFDKHAVRAFEVHALDYLLKPFEYDRLRQSVQRARAQLAQSSQEDYQTRLFGLLEDLQKTQPWNRIAVRDAGRIVFVKPDEVDWIEAEGNYL